MKRALVVVVGLVAGIAGGQAAAQALVPERVTFTARLVDNGQPVTGSHDLKFDLFDLATGGAAIWTETQPGVVFTSDGLCFVELGSSNALTATILDGTKKYLQVTVDSTTVMSPRIGLVSVPYAIRATDSARLGGVSASGYQLRVTGTCTTGNAVRTVNADGTVQCEPVGTGTGDITDVNTAAGSGLTGGAVSGAVNLSLVTCANGQVLQYTTGTGWGCANVSGGGGTVTSVGTGPGLTGGPITTSGTIGLAASVQNWATQPLCAAGSSIRTVTAAGVPTCEPDDNSGGTVTSITAGTGLTGGIITTAGTIGLAATVQNWATQPICAAGSAIRTVTATGVPTCETIPPAGVTGSGAANNVAFWTGASTLGTNADLFWDNTNARLGIGASAPNVRLHVAGYPAFTGAGDVTGFAGGTALTGSATLFVSQVAVGSVITTVLPCGAGGNGQTRLVTAVATDTSLTVSLPWTTNIGNCALSIIRPVARLGTSATATNLILNGLGNVGIGTATPAAALDVAGQIRSGVTQTVTGVASFTFAGLNGDADEEYELTLRGRVSTLGVQRTIRLAPNGILVAAGFRNIAHRFYEVAGAPGHDIDIRNNGAFTIGFTDWNADGDFFIVANLAARTGRSRILRSTHVYANSAAGADRELRGDHQGWWSDATTNITSLAVSLTGGTFTGTATLRTRAP